MEDTEVVPADPRAHTCPQGNGTATRCELCTWMLQGCYSTHSNCTSSSRLISALPRHAGLLAWPRECKLM